MSPDRAITTVHNVRPGAIETPDQKAFVRTLRAVPERTPPTSPDAIRSRAVGTLVGLLSATQSGRPSNSSAVTTISA